MTTHVPLGDLVDITRGTTYKSALLDLPGPVLLGLASIGRNGEFRAGSLRTYGGESPEQLLVRSGDLFASLKDVTQSADLLGSVARMPPNVGLGRLTQDTVRLDVKSAEVDRDFLYFQLLSPTYRSFCRAHATGTTNLGLPRSDFLSYPVWLPRLVEQRRIAGVLGALDDLIQTNRRLMDALDELGVALFRSRWRGSWEPIASLGEVTMGQSPPGATLSEDSEGIPFFQGVRDFGDRFPQRRVFTTAPRRTAPKGSILIAVRAPIGDTNVAIEDVAIGRGLACLRAVQPAIALRALRASPVTWDAYRGSGTVFASISGADLRAAKVPWVDDPGLEESLNVFDEQYRALHVEAEELRRTRDELLPLLMSGRIRVAEAEELVA